MWAQIFMDLYDSQVSAFLGMEISRGADARKRDTVSVATGRAIGQEP